MSEPARLEPSDAVPSDEDLDPESEVRGSGDDPERRRRASPRQKKSLEYVKDRRGGRSYGRHSRHSWPRLKSLPQRVARRQVKRQLVSVLGTVSPLDTDVTSDALQPHTLFGGGAMSLRDWLRRARERRLGATGRKQAAGVAHGYSPKWFASMLETLMSERSEASRRVAQIIRLTLELPSDVWGQPLPSAHQFGHDTLGHGRSCHCRHWMAALDRLFAERPEWKDRLRQWIDADD